MNKKGMREIVKSVADSCCALDCLDEDEFDDFIDDVTNSVWKYVLHK